MDGSYSPKAKLPIDGLDFPLREIRETINSDSPLANYPKTESYSSKFPLSKAKIGSSLRIVGFVQNAKRHEILGMGFRLKTKLKIVHLLPGGNIVVIHGSEKIGLSEEIASQILVSDES